MPNDSNPILSKALERGTVSAFDLVASILRDLGKRAWDQHLVKRAIDSYYENYLDRHGKIKILGMSEPISLYGIYTSVKVINPTLLLSFQSIKELEGLYRKTSVRRLFIHNDEKRNGVDVANEYQCLNVLGAPGSGKTTFLRRMGLEALLPTSNQKHPTKKASEDEYLLLSNYQHSCLPVFIELRRLLINGKLDLERSILREFQVCGFPESERFVQKALESGRLLVLLDGLDEVSSEYLTQTIDHITDFTQKYKKNRFITSCRTAFYKSAFPHFTDVVLTDFDDTQIEHLITNWFKKKSDLEQGIAHQFCALLREEKNKAILELARTPLLLTFLCLVYDNTQRLPANRSTLYKRALEILLERWAAEKRIHNEPVYQDLHPELEIVMLSEIAGPAFEADTVFFTQEDLTNRVSQFLQKEVNAPKVLNAGLVIEAIEIQQGLLVQRATGIYSFSHLTIQEYLAANYYNQGRKRIQLIEKGLLNDRWREIFLLIAGFSQADEFLLELAEEAQRFTNRQPVIQNLLAWVQNVIIIGESTQSNLLKRAAAMYCAIAFSQAYMHSLLIEKLTQRELSPDQAVSMMTASDKRSRRVLGHLLMLLLELSDDEDCQIFKSCIDDLADYNFQRTAHKHSTSNLSLSSVQKYAISLALEGLEPWSEIQIFRGAIEPTVTSLKNFNAGQGSIADSEVNIKLSSYIENICSSFLGFNVRKKIPTKEMLKIELYVYAIELIVECKKAALSVSIYGWRKACNQLLTKK